MKNKWFILVLALVLAMSLTGCRLAREPGEGAAIPGMENADRLIGVYVTDSTGGADLPFELMGEDGKLWAEESNGTWTFPGVEGWVLFAPFVAEADGYGYHTSSIDLVESGIHVNISDERTEGLELTGKLVLLKGVKFTLSLNPVYQTEDGRLYLTMGDSYLFNTEETGGLGSLKLTETANTTADGKEKTYTASAEIQLLAVERPETVTVLQMDNGGSVLDRQEYEAGRAPERVVPVNGAAYLIVETRSAGGAAARQLVQPGDESFTTLFNRGNGACGQVLTEVGWPGM